MIAHFQAVREALSAAAPRIASCDSAWRDATNGVRHVPARTSLMLVAALLSCANMVRAEGLDVRVEFYAKADLVPAAERIAAERLPAETRQLLKDRGVVLLAYPTWMKDACAVDVGYARPVQEGRSQRAPYQKAWAVSAQRPGESRADTCGRAFGSAIENLRESGDLSETIRKTVDSDLAQSAYRMARNLPARPDTLYSYTSGLNEQTQAALPDWLGAGFLRTFDYRKFAVYVDLMAYKTMEGKEGCMVRTGLTARVTDGARHRLPGTLYTRYLEREPGAPLCTRGLVEAALSDMSSDVLSEDAYAAFELVAEPGVKYPGRKDLLAAKAAADRLEARRKREAELQESKKALAQSRTVSRNVVRCTNQCVNGSCLRTFEDGRQERWQAPRVYRFGNWEWDTTTNACGR